MPQALRREVCEANLRLPALGLVTLTWGNVSALDAERGLVVIKGSGIPYADLTPAHMSVVDLADGRCIAGPKPSSDLATHLALYRRFPVMGGVVHTHSRWATVWAQAGRDIPVLGTTHADYFCGPVPCARPLTLEETAAGYEEATGRALAELFTDESVLQIPAALAAGHGPFAWGRNAAEGVEHALVLEEIAMTAWHTLALEPEAKLAQHVLDKHFSRKHGKNAYYGQ